MSRSQYQVVVADSFDAIQTHLPAWWDLHEARLADNLFTSPAFLPHVYRFYGDRLGVQVAFVYRLVSGLRTLVAVAPFGAPRPGAGGSVQMIRGCDSKFVYTSTPLLHREHTGAATSAIWGWLDAPRRPWSIVCWDAMELDSPAWEQLRGQIDDRGRRWWIRDLFQRPKMLPRPGVVDVLAELPPRTRSEYRRSLRKLESAGEVQVRLHRNLGDLSLPARFLEMEARGWKGDRGSALNSTREATEFFACVTESLAARNELFFVEVGVDGTPISMTANFVDGTTVFGFKVAHDPAWRAAAPGLHNTLEVLRLVCQDRVLQAADSGSSADSFLGRYWPDSGHIGTVMAATRGFRGAVVLSMLPAARRTRHGAQRLLARLRSLPHPATA